jgi:SAM-dependent methyltransferase
LHARIVADFALMLAISEACERNKGPILAVLQREFAACHSALEIGSGTGQHAVYFAAHLPGLSWQPSEVPALLPMLSERTRAEGGANLRAPVALDVRVQPWPVAASDAVFTANTLHIMSWPAVEDFFRGVEATLRPGGVLCVYGPFRYRGEHTSQSNADFDLWLRQHDPHSGIRDFEALDELARGAQLAPAGDHAMPANNRTLTWRRP